MNQNLVQPDENENLPTDQILHQWLQNQREEQRTRQLELEIQKDDNHKNFELARESLRLQAEYMKVAPRHLIHSRLVILGFLVLVLLTIVGLIMYCVYMNKEDIALRVLEIAFTAIISGGGGYFAGKNAYKKSDLPDPSKDQIA